MSPNMLAVLAALCFSVAVFPWSVASKRVGVGGLMIIMGLVYTVTGLVLYLRAPEQKPLISPGGGFGLITAGLNATALVCCGIAFASSKVNLPVCTAITAAYPLGTALIALIILRQKFTPLELGFIVVGTACVVGLGIVSAGK